MLFLIIFVILLLGRANSSILGYEFLNTDELVIGSKALRLIKNNFNIYEFDGDTSGILNGLFLTWPKILNLDITYLSIRLSAVILLSLILYYTYKILAKNLEKKTLYILFLPLLLFYSFSKDPDFLHYTNELVACFLIVFSYYFIFSKDKVLTSKKAFLISALSGGVLFAKMQFFPIAAVNIFLLFLRQLFKFKNIKISIVICFGFLSPLIIISLYYYLNNNFLDLFYNVIHYPLSDLIARNLETDQVLADTNNLIAISNSEKLHMLVDHLFYNSVFHLLYFYFFSFLIFMIFFNNYKIFFRNLNFELIMISISIIFTLIISLGTGSVHRHYLIILLPMIPIFLCFVFRYYEIKKDHFQKIEKILIFIFSIFIVSLIFENFKFYSKKFVHSNFKQNKLHFYSPNILEYLKLESDEKIIIWGWKPEIYLLSNLSPASRDTINQKQIDFKSNRDYFRKRFIDDLNKNKPALVIDYVKPKAYMFTNKNSNVNSFPELKKILKNKYVKFLNENSNCPDFYMQKIKSKKFKKNLVSYSFETENKDLMKMNDFHFDEETCDTAIIFNEKYSDRLKLLPENKNLGEIMVLASKKNTEIEELKITINYKDNKKDIKKIMINKYPFWSKLPLKNNEILNIELDVSELKKNKSGISEIKLFRNN